MYGRSKSPQCDPSFESCAKFQPHLFSQAKKPDVISALIFPSKIPAGFTQLLFEPGGKRSVIPTLRPSRTCHGGHLALLIPASRTSCHRAGG